MNEGAEFAFTFDEPGTYDYVCRGARSRNGGHRHGEIGAGLTPGVA